MRISNRESTAGEQTRASGSSSALHREPRGLELAWSIAFGMTLATSAFLLFVVQPLLGKAVLPILGGSPSVWTTCVAFFQTALLAGYLYAHLHTRWLGNRSSVLLHFFLLGLALLLGSRTLSRIALEPPSADATPAWWLVERLTLIVGLPFLLLSGTTPLLQRWYVATGGRRSGDPYFLYAASNLGSLLALLVYPTLIEPHLTLSDQTRAWMGGFGLLGILILICGQPALTRVSDTIDRETHRQPLSKGWHAVTLVARRAALAFIPSSLLVGVTSYLTTDVASAPMLWVVPLALYLATMIAAFAPGRQGPFAWARWLAPFLVLLLTPALAAGLVQPFWIPVHLAAFTLISLVCHDELSRLRTGTSDLTGYYLAIALGGAMGGLFNALLAPALFDRIVEYPFGIILGLLAIPPATQIATPRGHTTWARDLWIPLAVLVLGFILVRNILGVAESVLGAFAIVVATGLATLVISTYRSRPRRFALLVGAILIIGGASDGVDGQTLYRDRSFFGVLRVTHDSSSRMNRLFHGSTLHGQQSTLPGQRTIPLSYFHPSGPIGDVFESRRRHPGRVGEPRAIAVVGLGIGSLAAYARPDESWTFFELDPNVVSIASDTSYFSYLADCLADCLHIRIGDARHELQRVSDGTFDVIILDAFTSDALPTHLMTREAVRIYANKLRSGGLLAFNVSNRYLDLEPILGGILQAENLVGLIRYDLNVSREERSAGKLPSIWAVAVRRAEDLATLANNPGWTPLRKGNSASLWTDQWTSPLSAWRRTPLGR